MPTVAFTSALRSEYQSLFDTCQVKPAKAEEVERIVSKLVANKSRYGAVGEPLGVPWHVIAAIHSMECSGDFGGHLHNGDPLSARTIRVPKGRPVAGNPPFTWEQSATDAVTYDGFPAWDDWTIPGVLYSVERFNGWGYRLHHPDVKSPYLWSGSNHYVSGKYVSDGTWSDTAVSRQCGAATLLRRLAEMGEFDAEPYVVDAQFAKFAEEAASFEYSPNKVTPGGVDLQQFLNRFPGIYLKEDGMLGPRTSAACKRIFGRYLAGDPRE